MESDTTSRPANTDRPSRKRRLGLALLVLGVVGLLGAYFQDYSGWGFPEKMRIGPADKITVDGQAFRWGLGKRDLTETQMQSVAILENGKPFARRAQHLGEAVERGAGWYHARGGYIRFAPADNTDPRTNGRHYDLVFPRSVKLWIWWLAVGCAVAGAVLLRRPPVLPILKPAWARFGIVFLIFFAVRLVQVPHALHHNDGVMSLKGVPESDAGGWHGMGVALAEGRGLEGGFQSQRPGYSVLLGLAYLAGGKTVVTGLVVNAMLHALACTAVLILGAMLGSWVLGWMTALWILFSSESWDLAWVLLTENPGLAFGALGLVMFWVAVQRPGLWSFALAGLVMGIGNLSSGVYLLTIPLYAMAIPVLAWHEEWGWRNALRLLASFTLGVFLVFMPWLIRQKIEHGAFTPSTNTAELLYGGAHPVEKKLTKKLHEEAARDGFGVGVDYGGRYRYFSDKFKAVVKEDPVRYAKQVLLALKDTEENTPHEEAIWYWLVRWLVLLAAIASAMRSRSWLPAMAGALLLVALPRVEALPWTACIVGAATLSLAFARREERVGWALLTLTTIAVLLIAALAGNVATTRFLACGDWPLFMLYCGGLLAVLRLITDFLGRGVKFWAPKSEAVVETPVPVVKHAPAWIWKASHGVVIFAVLAVAGTMCAYAWRQTHAWPLRTLSEADGVTIRTQVIRAHPDAAVHQLPTAQLLTAIVEFDDRRTKLEAFENLGSMTRTYEERPYARWVATTRRLDAMPVRSGELLVQAAGDLRFVPPGKPMVIVGTWNAGEPGKFGHEMGVFEMLAAFPLGKNADGDVSPVWADAVWFDATPEALGEVGS